VSQLVDSQALQAVSKSLQLSTPGSQETLFIDERLEQILDVGPLIRRGLTLAGTEGLYTANIRNTHGGVEGNVATVINPWELGGVARPPFPEFIPKNLDLWLIGFCAELVTGSGDFGAAFLDLQVPTTHQAFGTITTNIILAGWNEEQSLAGVTMLMHDSPNNALDLFTKINLRVPRDATIRWHTRNIGATSPVFQVNLMLGLFAAGMGQDGGY